MISRVLVAGGTSRLGTLVVKGLAARGVAVRVMTRDPQRAVHLAGERIELVTGDVRDPASALAAAAGVDAVVSAVHGFAGPGGVSPTTVDLTVNELARMVVAHRGGSDPRHIPRAALHAMAATIGRLRPELGRQARAALAMDRSDLTFSGGVNDARARYPDPPCTAPAEALRAFTPSRGVPGRPTRGRAI